MTDARWAWVEIGCTVAAPTVILMWGTERIGPMASLVVALSFPVVFAIVSMVREGRPSGLALLSLLSVSLTGGVGLLALDPTWFAVKEAAIPFGFGAMFAGSAFTKRTAVDVVLDRVLDPERIKPKMTEPAVAARVRGVTRRATLQMAGVTALSGVANFILARSWVTAAAGTPEFTEQLGDYTGGSFVVINLPVMALTMWVLTRAFAALEAAFGEPLDNLLRTAQTTKPPRPDSAKGA